MNQGTTVALPCTGSDFKVHLHALPAFETASSSSCEPMPGCFLQACYRLTAPEPGCRAFFGDFLGLRRRATTCNEARQRRRGLISGGRTSLVGWHPDLASFASLRAPRRAGLGLRAARAVTLAGRSDPGRGVPVGGSEGASAGESNRRFIT